MTISSLEVPGAGGGVMASRLSEDPQTKVLLIEAGSSDFMDQNILVPNFASRLPNSKFVPGLDNRVIEYPRGHVLGGSTAINQMEYSRGSRDDFGRWARVTEDDGWTWDELLPYIFKMEMVTPPPDHHNTSGQFNPALHGTKGPVATSVEGLSLPIDALGREASSQLHEQFPFNLDYNSGDTIGISWVQSTIKASNLDILVNTQVTKVLPVGTGEKEKEPVIRGVQFAQSANGTRFSLNATKEVILSAGAVKTPHLLMLSGIGDTAYLSSMGMEPLIDLPAVGQNLQDHVYLPNSWTVNSTNTLDNLRLNATLAAEALDLWRVNSTGPLGLGPASQFGWLRVPQNSSVAGPTSAHFELILHDQYSTRTVPAPSEGHFFSIATNVISPTSRGNISLASLDPFVSPVINPNLLGTSLDVAIPREAIKAARAFVSAPAWEGYITGEFGQFADAKTDEEIEAYARANSDTVDHVVGTPFIISGHTQTPTYVLAERAADLVRRHGRNRTIVHISPPLTRP
ncbi:GMC oxidoreductase-domain-containing protein [Amylostereum chailletii]|nr:GMC oxidoreductase-domain-containing protein [Amylostereum chailletii]